MAGIPKFDRREVDGARLAFSGSVDDSTIILPLEAEVTVVVKARVTGVAFKPNQFGVLRRVHSLRVDHAVMAEDHVAEELAREIKRREDEESGQTSIDGEIDAAAEGTNG